MKKLAPFLFIAFIAISSAHAQFAGGEGTEDDPYQIATLEQLQAVGDSVHLDKHFIQIADIDASDTESWNEGKGFEPIGSSSNHSFTGSYDGNGHEISGLHIDRPERDGVGLFGFVYPRSASGTIANLCLHQINIAGRDRVGGLIGFIRWGGKVSGVCVSGNISGGNTVGGLVGDGRNGQISNSNATVNVTGSGAVGGLVGSRGIITNSIATGDVTGGSSIGGLVGGGSLVENSVATGNVYGTRFVGGLAGSVSFVHASYATGDVFGNRYVGGLVGYINIPPEEWEVNVVSQSYATGKVSGGEYAGGFVGRNDREQIKAGYWDVLSSGTEHGVGFESKGSGKNKVPLEYPPTINDVTGLETEQMQEQNAWIYMHKFDFDQTWQLTEGYPRLRWEEPEDSVQAPEAAIIWVTMEGREYERFEVVDFGAVESDGTTSETLTLQNTGNIVMSGDVRLSGADSDVFTITKGEGTYSLEPDSSRSIEIVFHPSDVSDYQAILEIAHDALNESSPREFRLEGSGKESTSVEVERQVPGKPLLHQNYPNPFNPSTQIRFALPEAAHVQLTVYNLIGQRVATLVNETRPAGWYDVTFDASVLSSGTFIYRLEAGEYVETKSMMFVK